MNIMSSSSNEIPFIYQTPPSSPTNSPEENSILIVPKELSTDDLDKKVNDILSYLFVDETKPKE